MAVQPLSTSPFIAQETIVASGLTFPDYLKQFDGQHAEWLCGDVIIMTNNTQHADILGFVLSLLRLYLGMMKLGKALPVGVSMYLGDQQPAREPDVVIGLNDHLDRIKATFLDGAADIVIEIVSPESEMRDYVLKYREYETAGVREY